MLLLFQLDLQVLNQCDSMEEFNLRCHVLGDCLRQYNGFLSLHTKEESSVYPLGCSIQIYSSNLPYIKEILSLLFGERET